MTRRILVIYNSQLPAHKERSALYSHLRMLDTLGADIDIIYYNTITGYVPPALYRADIDALILHTRVVEMRWRSMYHYHKRYMQWVKDLDCLKIALPQDEYDFAETLDEWLYELGVTHVFSNFGAESWPILYPLTSSTRAQFNEIFTGYIDEAAAKRIAPMLKPIAERPLDIVYRARHLPVRFGSYGQLKHRVGEVVAERAAARGLKIDISSREEDTIYGEGWFDFLASGRVVIGVESGSSAIEPRGNIHARSEYLKRLNPNLTFDEISAQLTPGWDGYNFLAIGPRHLEAVITKTAQVLVEGSYSGVLRTGEHYIPLNRDFSNLDSVLDQLADNDALQRMVDNAYRDIYLSGKYTYRAGAEKVLRVIEEAPDRPHRDSRKWAALRRYGAVDSELRRRLMVAQVDMIARFWKYVSNT